MKLKKPGYERLLGTIDALCGASEEFLDVDILEAWMEQLAPAIIADFRTGLTPQGILSLSISHFY